MKTKKWGAFNMEGQRPSGPFRLLPRVCATFVITLCLAGCSSDMSDLDAYAAEVKSRPGPPLDPLPIMQQFETFEYKAHELRDPFSVQSEAEAAEIGESGLRPDPNRRKELLESFPLDGLKMVGTLGDGGTVVALVVDPERVIYRVEPGNYMGQNEGRILGISEGQIDLLELVSDGAGGWIERQATVALDEK